jgi:hypothetical protein
MEKSKSKVERTFSTEVRMPYQDAIGLILHMIDYHNIQMIKYPEEQIFHEKQALRLKNWLIDMKTWIHQQEEQI